MVDSSTSARPARLTAIASITASVILASLNIAAGIVTSSTSVFAAGVEFAGDVLASAMVLIGMILAVRPADADHPYGHGRLETVAALGVGAILSLGGIGICWNSLQAIGASHPPPGRLAIVVLIATIFLRAGMFTLKLRVGRGSRSESLVADAWNDMVDILAAAVALTAVALARYDENRFLAADHYGGFAVGVIVVLTGMRVLRDASLALIDTMPQPGMMESLRAVAAGVPGVAGVDKNYARKTGFKYHVDLHIEVDPALRVDEAHAIAGLVRSSVREHIDWVADVLVHVEPAVGPHRE